MSAISTCRERRYMRLLKQAYQSEEYAPPKAALEQVERLLEQYPDRTELRLIRTRLWVRLGRIDDAQEELRVLVRQNPDHIEASLQLVGVLLCRGHFDSGVEEFLRSATRFQRRCDAPDPSGTRSQQQVMHSLWNSYMTSGEERK